MNYQIIGQFTFYHIFLNCLKNLCIHVCFYYVDKYQFIMPLQHGFQPGNSTVMSLLNLQDSISAAIDCNEYSLGVFIDIAKALDSQPRTLIEKKWRTLVFGKLP